jgi:hypothetical protein
LAQPNTGVITKLGHKQPIKLEPTCIVLLLEPQSSTAASASAAAAAAAAASASAAAL